MMTATMDPYRKLMILGINRLVEDGRVSLSPTGEDGRQSGADGHIFAELGGHPSVISWSGIGFDQMRISVWWKYDHSKHPQAELTGSSKEMFRTSQPLAKHQHYPKFVGVTASAWLERRTGHHIQGRGREGLFDLYTRRGEQDTIAALPKVKANGYEPEGPLFLF